MHMYITKNMKLLTETLILIVIAITLFCVLGFIIINASIVFVRSVAEEPPSIITQFESKYVLPPSLNAQDSITVIRMAERIDAVEKASSESLADLRQESNNIINKVNGWLAFWIAIITIFCGGVPFVIQ